MIAEFLGGAWRESLAEPPVSAEELSEIAPLLMGSGAGALAWWRIHRSSLSVSAAAAELQDAYRLHTLHALIYKQKIKRAFSTLRSSSIEPILIKGWANARLYPEAGLRPYGDVDLCVSPDDYDAAAELLLARPEGRECTVDLHRA
ncbi:MAG TPA: nucleotidyltransferase family protein, partial [Pyrinomonadaceae bacterium]|nr:nucleotidyltransferase family protein [Pyrinomonadaceae bacterium]